MDKLFNKIKNNIKGKSKSKEEDQYKQQIDNEIKKRDKAVVGSAPPKQFTPSSTSSDETITYDNIPDNEGGAYQVLEVIKVGLPSSRQNEVKGEYLDNSNSKNTSWAIDSMLIDEEMLYLEDEEADRMYQELKQRSVFRRNLEEKENRLNIAMQAAADEEAEEDGKSQAATQANKINQGSNQSFEKIRKFITKSNQQEKLEFTQGLLNFANKIDPRFLTEGLLPNLEILAKETNQDIKRALLDQFIPLIMFIREKNGQEGYDSTVKVLFPILDQMLYDDKEVVRDKAIQILTDIRTVVLQKENDHIMNLTLKLAHDDAEQNKVSALRILNELAPDMGQTLCECYIVPEIRSLGIDEQSSVRQTVAKNMLNISKIVSLDYFTGAVFPLYNNLTQDKDEKVRKTCAEVVAEIANVSPLDKNGQALAEIYYRFLKDPSSKIVRGTAFQNIGPFIAALKELKDIDQRIIDFYVQTTDNSSNKDVCYYSSFNFPAFVYTLGRERWDEFRKIYHKLAKFNDGRIKKTLACSIHELARILGPEITEADLVPIMERFLKDNVNDIKVGALRNLHVFLAEVKPENRHQFIKYVQYVDGVTESQYEWRTKLVLAQNLGKFAQLYDPETVYDRFLPMFFKFCNETVVQVSSGASTSLVYILEKFQDNIQKLESIVHVVKKTFFEANTFKKRQIFIMMCGEAMNKKELFEKYFKYEMLSLVGDRVPNVRMCLSRVLRQHFLGHVNGAFVFDQDVNDAVRLLKKDKSLDVREHLVDIQTFPLNQEDSQLSLEDFSQRIREQMIRRQSSPINDTSDLETVNSSLVASEAQPQWERAQVQEVDDDDDDMKPQHDNSDEEQVQPEISPEIIIPQNDSPKVEISSQQEEQQEEEHKENDPVEEEHQEKEQDQLEEPEATQQEKEAEEEPAKEIQEVTKEEE